MELSVGSHRSCDKDGLLNADETELINTEAGCGAQTGCNF